MPSCRGSSWPRNRNDVSWTAGRFFISISYSLNFLWTLYHIAKTPCYSHTWQMFCSPAFLFLRHSPHLSYPTSASLSSDLHADMDLLLDYKPLPQLPSWGFSFLIVCENSLHLFLVLIPGFLVSKNSLLIYFVLVQPTSNSLLRSCDL